MIARAAGRPWVLARNLVVGAFAWAMAGTPVSAQDASLEQIERDLARDRARAEELQRQAEAIVLEVRALRAESISVARQAQEYEAEIAALEEQLIALQREEADRLAALAARRAQLTGTLAALQRIALRPIDAVLVAPGRAIDTARGAVLLRVAVPAVEERARNLRDELDGLAALHQHMSLRREELADANGALDGKRARLADLIARKNALHLVATSEQEAAEHRAHELAAQAQDLRDLLARIEREAAEREAAEREAAARQAAERKAAERKAAEREAAERVAAARKATEQKAAERGTAAGPVDAAAKDQPARQAGPEPGTAERRLALVMPETIRDFPATRASLVMPVQGRVVLRYGQARAESGRSRGLVIATRVGAQVVAPFDGRVVYAGPFRGYGQILIIEHGGRYHTLLAGLERIDAVVGQWLLAGEPVGVLGASPDGDPELYLELRRAGQTINPLPWLATTGEKVRG